MHRPTAAYLCPPGFHRPKALAITREARVLLEAARYARRTTLDRACPHTRRSLAREQAEQAPDPVLLVPGFMAGDYTLSMMSRHLRARGHWTYAASIRTNAGCLAQTSEALERRLEAIAERRGAPVTLVGHSLGGLLARALAARRPDLVSGLVTLGSPHLAPAAVHLALLANIRLLAWLERSGLSVMSSDCSSGECARAMWEEAQIPLSEETPYYSVYSRRDGILDWRACLDPAAELVQVSTSHCGMALDPAVFEVVTDALAEIGARRLRQEIRVVAG